MAYLVLLRHSCDDLPIRLFDSYDEARRFARKTKPYPSRDVVRALQLECCTPVGVDIVEYDDDGLLMGIEEVKRFDE